MSAKRNKLSTRRTCSATPATRSAIHQRGQNWRSHSKCAGAALLMSSTRSILRLVAQDGWPLAEVLRQVNTILLDDFPTARFVTMIYALLDPKERRVELANAGHLPPLLVEATGASFLETTAGLPLGIRAGNPPSDDATVLILEARP